jgi:hypothetical protein
MVPTTDRDQLLFINNLYYPPMDNITTITQPLAKLNIMEQLQTPILTTTELSLNNDKVIHWNISPTNHNHCHEAYNIGDINCPQGDKDQDFTGGRHHWKEDSQP